MLAVDAASPAVAVPALAVVGLGWLVPSGGARSGRVLLVGVAVVGGLAGSVLHLFQAPGSDELLDRVEADLAPVVALTWSQVLDESTLAWTGPVVEVGGHPATDTDDGPSARVAAALASRGYHVEVLGPGELEQPEAGYPGPAWNVAASRAGIDLLVAVDRVSVRVQAWWTAPLVGRWPFGPVDAGRSEEPGVVSITDWFAGELFGTIVSYASAVAAVVLVAGAVLSAWLGRSRTGWP